MPVSHCNILAVLQRGTRTLFFFFLIYRNDNFNANYNLTFEEDKFLEYPIEYPSYPFLYPRKRRAHWNSVFNEFVELIFKSDRVRNIVGYKRRNFSSPPGDKVNGEGYSLSRVYLRLDATVRWDWQSGSNSVAENGSGWKTRGQLAQRHPCGASSRILRLRSKDARRPEVLNVFCSS